LAAKSGQPAFTADNAVPLDQYQQVSQSARLKAMQSEGHANAVIWTDP
jgi:hypothetical protein